MTLERVVYFLMATILALLAWQDFAGAQEQQASPRERAFLERINAEVGNNLTCSTNAVVLQDRLQKMERELADAKKQSSDIKPEPSGDQK